MKWYIWYSKAYHRVNLRRMSRPGTCCYVVCSVGIPWGIDRSHQDWWKHSVGRDLHSTPYRQYQLNSLLKRSPVLYNLYIFQRNSLKRIYLPALPCSIMLSVVSNWIILSLDLTRLGRICSFWKKKLQTSLCAGWYIYYQYYYNYILWFRDQSLFYSSH